MFVAGTDREIVLSSVEANRRTSLCFGFSIRQVRIRIACGSRCRNLNSEGRSSSQFALQRDGSLVKLHDPLRNGETQARATEFTAAGLVDAIEPFKDSGLILRRNANAGIFNTQRNLIVAPFGRERDFSGRGRVL